MRRKIIAEFESMLDMDFSDKEKDQFRTRIEQLTNLKVRKTANQIRLMLVAGLRDQMGRLYGCATEYQFYYEDENDWNGYMFDREDAIRELWEIMNEGEPCHHFCIVIEKVADVKAGLPLERAEYCYAYPVKGGDGNVLDFRFEKMKTNI